jgi:hypothetical protein
VHGRCVVAVARCPYTNLTLIDAGDGIVMCEECVCWGFSKEIGSDNDTSDVE